MEYFNPSIENPDRSEQIRQAAIAKLYEFEQEQFFIDKGGVGKVYELPQGYCLKVIEDRHNSPNNGMFTLGNRPIVEARIQEQMSNTVYDGPTRAPKLFGVLNAEKLGDPNAIIMERLQAINLQHIIKGLADPPETFSTEPFFDELERYIKHMHGQENIVHLDLYARNIMVDIQSGAPRVIDFGRANRITNTTPTEQRHKLEDVDWETLEKAYQDIDKIL